MTYVYRLNVTLPEGSDVEGWEPENWVQWCDDRGWYGKDGERYPSFSWAKMLRRKHFLSSGAANRRAVMLRAFGATVEVERSAPVFA